MNKICFFISLFLLTIGRSQEPKRVTIIEEILFKCETIGQLKKIIKFVETHNLELPEIFTYIPDINPINPNNNLSISSSFSTHRLHPIYGKYKAHNGIDIVAPIKTPVYASASGIISKSKFYNGSAGHSLIIDHKYGFQTKYFHLLFFIVKKGDKVKKGDLIGYLGNSGGVTGPHLHYEVLKNKIYLDPIYFIEN